MAKILVLENYGLVISPADVDDRSLYRVDDITDSIWSGDITPILVNAKPPTKPTLPEERRTTIQPIIRITGGTAPVITFCDTATNTFIDVKDTMVFLHYWVMAELKNKIVPEIRSYYQGPEIGMRRGDLVYVIAGSMIIAVRVSEVTKSGTDGNILGIYAPEGISSKAGYYAITDKLPEGITKDMFQPVVVSWNSD